MACTNKVINQSNVKLKEKRQKAKVKKPEIKYVPTSTKYHIIINATLNKFTFMNEL